MDQPHPPMVHVNNRCFQCLEGECDVSIYVEAFIQSPVSALIGISLFLPVCRWNREMEGMQKI